MTFVVDTFSKQSACGNSHPIVESVDHIARKVQAIKNNTNAIVNAIFSSRKYTNFNQKIVLGVGELHENGLHVIQQIDILKELKENGLNCATALEWPSNNIDLHIEEMLTSNKANQNTLKAMMEAKENNSLRNRLSADTEPIRTANARLSRALLHEFMDNHHIPVFCTDAPRDWDLYISAERKAQHLLASDSKVMEAINEAIRILNPQDGNSRLLPMASLNQLGMLARNIYTMNEIETILQEYPEIDVILIEAGRAHITGNDTLKPEPSPYENSLANLFERDSNHFFVGAPLYNSQEDKSQNTPSQASINSQILSLDYLNKSSFNTRSSNVSDLNEAAHMQSLSPYFPFIDETLCGRSPLELHNQRKETLSNSVRNLRHNNQFSRTILEHGMPRLVMSG